MEQFKQKIKAALPLGNVPETADNLRILIGGTVDTCIHKVKRLHIPTITTLRNRRIAAPISHELVSVVTHSTRSAISPIQSPPSRIAETHPRSASISQNASTTQQSTTGSISSVTQPSLIGPNSSIDISTPIVVCQSNSREQTNPTTHSISRLPPRRDPYRQRDRISDFVFKFRYSGNEVDLGLRKRVENFLDEIKDQMQSRQELVDCWGKYKAELLICETQLGKKYPAVVITCNKSMVDSLRSLLLSLSKFHVNLDGQLNSRTVNVHVRGPTWNVHIEVMEGLVIEPLNGAVTLYSTQAFFSTLDNDGQSYCGLSIVSRQNHKLASTAYILQIGMQKYGVTAAHAFIEMKDKKTGGLYRQRSADDLIGLQSDAIRGTSASLDEEVDVIIPSTKSDTKMRDYDFALIPLQGAFAQRQNSVVFPGESEVVNLSEAADRHPDVERNVLIISGDQKLTMGVLICGSIFLQLSAHAKMAELWSVEVIYGAGLGKGDSGSLVIDAMTYKIYGHVVSRSDTETLHIVPFCKVKEQIQDVLHMGNITLPQPKMIEEIGKTAESTMHTPSVRKDSPSNTSNHKKLEPNPLANVADMIIRARIDNALKNGLGAYQSVMEQALILVKSPLQWRDEALKHSCRSRDHNPITINELKSLENELGPIWIRFYRLPWPMWRLILICGLGAVAQGWNQSAINVAQVYYQQTLGLGTDAETFLIGLINGAPHLTCFISSWLSWPMNRFLGRRSSIFYAMFISFAFTLAQGFTQSWPIMLSMRLGIGLGIGLGSTTIPIYLSEIAPTSIRGSMVMLWQVFIAFGTMLGYASGAAFSVLRVGSDSITTSRFPASITSTGCSESIYDEPFAKCDLNWRFILGFPALASLILLFCIHLQPESPRWLIKQAQRKQFLNKSLKKSADYEQAFASLLTLNGNSKIKAARDFLIIDVLLWQEGRKYNGSFHSRNWILSEVRALFECRQNRSVLLASTILVIIQAYCGINILSSYSAPLILQATLSNLSYIESSGSHGRSSGVSSFIILSMVIGILNFFFSLPALIFVNRWRQRNLLLLTFIYLVLFQALIAVGFLTDLQNMLSQTVLVIAGMYLFVIAYSLGLGLVPSIYAVESFPQQTRDVGIAAVTSVGWLINFLTVITFPVMASSSFHITGVFWWYSAWYFVGFWLIVFFVPEIQHTHLEGLEKVFNKPIQALCRDNWNHFKIMVAARTRFGNFAKNLSL